MEESLKALAGGFPLTEEKLRTYSALALAYVGDAVYEVVIRTKMAAGGNSQPHRYHGEAVRYVSAAGQTRLMQAIKPLLTDEERAVFRRGRNAKSPTPAKHQTLHDYRIATGFEALMGYLYLAGRVGRLMELLAAGLAQMDADGKCRENGGE